MNGSFHFHLFLKIICICYILVIVQAVKDKAEKIYSGITGYLDKFIANESNVAL